MVQINFASSSSATAAPTPPPPPPITAASIAQQFRKLLQILLDDVRPFAELTADLLGPPPSIDHALARIWCNGVHFRGNYGRLLAAWCAICAIRQPVSAVVFAVVALAPTYFALVVRRGVVTWQLPEALSNDGAEVTLRYPTLHACLAAFSLLALYLFGRVGFALQLLLPPLIVCATHAMMLAPARRAQDLQRLVGELRRSLKAALSGDAAAEKAAAEGLIQLEEVEDGGAAGLDEDDGEAFFAQAGRTAEKAAAGARTEAMAERVEAIRKKYRPKQD